MPVKFWRVEELVTKRVERVDEAVERKPFRKARVVEVACSFVESLENGKAKEEDRVGQAVRQSPVKQRVEAARLVEVALVVVPFEAVKF